MRVVAVIMSCMLLFSGVAFAETRPTYEIMYGKLAETYKGISRSRLESADIIVVDRNCVDIDEIADIIRGDAAQVSGVDHDLVVVTTYANEITLRIEYATTKEEREQVDIFVKEWVGKNITDNMTDIEKARRIYLHCVAYDYYKTDPLDTSEAYAKRFEPYSLVAYGRGVCNAKAGLFRLLADEAGLKNRDVLGRIGRDRHIWNMVYIDGKWWHIDPTDSVYWVFDDAFMKTADQVPSWVIWDKELYSNEKQID